MRNRNLFASILLACLLAAGFGGAASTGKAAPFTQSLQNPGVNIESHMVEIKSRGRVRIQLPRGPAYIYNDYPYYYSRGYYPTHIGGYIYYPSSYSQYYTPKYDSQCAKWHKRCTANWGKDNSDYYGCMNYHRC